MMDYKDLGHRVRQIRHEKMLTQEKLAELIGISASFLGHIERGTRVASLDTLVALCNTLDVRADYLLAASLGDQTEEKLPESLSRSEKYKLGEFLRLAQETVKNWNKD